jgi:hypothetical protein
MGARNRVAIGLYAYWPGRARICRPFKEPRNRFPAWRTGTYRLARLHRLAESIPRNRFLGSINVYKYGLRLQRLVEFIPWNRFLGSINVKNTGSGCVLGESHVSQRRGESAIFVQATETFPINHFTPPVLEPKIQY